MQADRGWLARGIVASNDITAPRAFPQVAFAKQMVPSANQDFVFRLGDTQFRKRRLSLNRQASGDL